MTRVTDFIFRLSHFLSLPRASQNVSLTCHTWSLTPVTLLTPLTSHSPHVPAYPTPSLASSPPPPPLSLLLHLPFGRSFHTSCISFSSPPRLPDTLPLPHSYLSFFSHLIHYLRLFTFLHTYLLLICILNYPPNLVLILSYLTFLPNYLT